jgi:hypothetical protein
MQETGLPLIEMIRSFALIPALDAGESGATALQI